MLRGLLVLVLLMAIAAVGWLAFPPAKALTTQTLALRAADRAAANDDWQGVVDQLAPLAKAAPTEVALNLRYAEALSELEKHREQGESAHSNSKNEAEPTVTAQQVYARLWQAHKKDPLRNLTVGRAYANDLAHHATTRPLGLSILRELLNAHPGHPEVLTELAHLFELAGCETRYDKPTQRWLHRWAGYYGLMSIPQIPDLDQQFIARLHTANLFEQLAQDQDTTPHDDLIVAGQQYCNALLIRPEHVEARFNLGLTLMNLNVTETGVAQMKTAIDVLIANDDVARAQVLSEEAQRIKTSLYYSDPNQRLTPSDIDDHLAQCLTDPRLTVNLTAQ